MKNDKESVTVIDVTDGPHHIAQEMAENLVYPALEVLQQQFGNQFSVEVFQEFVKTLISQRIKTLGYDALHEFHGLIEEVEAEHFPEEHEPHDQYMHAFDPLGMREMLPKQKPIPDFLLIEGNPS